jgi:hypothetical protein
MPGMADARETVEGSADPLQYKFSSAFFISSSFFGENFIFFVLKIFLTNSFFLVVFFVVKATYR